jgi:ubiquinone/menaquinone biosynthesis C-methylase UbiE
MSIGEGETLEVELEESGWVWVRNAAGDCGWIPADRIEPDHRDSVGRTQEDCLIDGAIMFIPHFLKPDRYKIDSYNTYNFKCAETYDSCVWLRVFGVRHWDELVINALGPDIGTLNVLDVGCATGRLLTALCEVGAKSVNGMDLAPRILETAREKIAGRDMSAELRAADVEERIPWPDRTFDVVTLTGVFHHLMRPEDAMLEIERVLRRQGRLLIVDVRFPFPLRQIFNLYLRVRPSGGDYRFYSPSSVAKMLTALGWRSIKSSRAGWNGFMISAGRPDC